MTNEQKVQLAETIGEYAASQSNPTGVVFQFAGCKYTIADDWLSEQFETFGELLNAAQDWKDSFDEAKATA